MKAANLHCWFGVKGIRIGTTKAESTGSRGRRSACRPMLRDKAKSADGARALTFGLAGDLQKPVANHRTLERFA
jgi:hypothetical protein